jgi:hypothetical protein
MANCSRQAGSDCKRKEQQQRMNVVSHQKEQQGSLQE